MTNVTRTWDLAPRWRTLLLAGLLALAPGFAAAQDGGEGTGEPAPEVEELDLEGEGSPGGDDTPTLPLGPSPIAPEEAAEKSAGARKEELGKTAYRFCHDPEFGKSGTEGKDFCAIFDASTDEVCPEARKSCPGWVETDLCEPGESCRRAQLSGKSAKGKRRTRVTQRSSSSPFELRIPTPIAWVLIAVFGAAILYWFLRALRDAGWESDEKPNLDGSSPLGEAERNLLALPEARAKVLIDHAERSLERGDALEAAILLHLAVLRHLDDEGLARWHPSKTNGDYLRAIRSNRVLAALFRAIAGQTERIRFGDGQVDPALIAAAIPDARRLLVRATAGPAQAEETPPPSSASISGGTAILLVMLASGAGQACGGDPPDPAFHARGPTGMGALVPLLRSVGITADVSRSRLAKLPADTGVVVLRTSAGDERIWPVALALDKTLDRDISVVIVDDLWRAPSFLPVTATASHDREAISVALDPPTPTMFCTWSPAKLGPLPSEGAQAVRLPHGRRLLASGAKTSSVSKRGLELAPIMSYHGDPSVPGRGRAALAWAIERTDGADPATQGTTASALAGCTYVFADRDLFTNASLTREANARLVASFFASLVSEGRRVVFLDRFDLTSALDTEGGEEEEEEDEGPAKPLQASNMLPFLAQGLVALVAFYLAIGAAFGPLRDRVTREHKSFVEHVEAIGRQYARTGLMGLTHSARSLARLVVMRQRDQLRGGTSGGWAGLASHLAQKHGLDEKDVRAALRLGIDGTSELGAPGADDPSPSSERMLRTLSRLLGGREGDKKPTAEVKDRDAT